MDKFATHVDVVRPPNGARRLGLRASFVRVRDGDDVCDRVQAWNELRGDVSLLAKMPSNAHSVNPWRSTTTIPIVYTVRAPGQYLLQVADVRSGDTKTTAALEGREVYACVRALPPRLVAGASYFSPSFIWSRNRDQSVLPETRGEWHGPSGFGGALGMSRRTRSGIGPSSWDQTAQLTGSDTNGSVPYTLRTFSIYPGLSYAERVYPTNEECVNFGQCLRAHFPGTPITGVSNVNAQSKDKLSLVILSNGGCDEDAGIARSFVETWGVRRYSDTRSCSLRLIDFFDNVSADMQGQAGLQFGTQFSGAVHNERKGRRAGLGADRATGNACRRGCNAHLERTFGSQATPPGCPR